MLSASAASFPMTTAILCEDALVRVVATALDLWRNNFSGDIDKEDEELIEDKEMVDTMSGMR